jgi:high-affinity iron transporter
LPALLLNLGAAQTSSYTRLIMSVLTQIAFIIFREGLEAILVVGAMAAYLKSAGNTQRISALYIGAAAGVAASAVFAWIFEGAYQTVSNSIVQCAVVFIAAALMLYVSGWLFISQQDALLFSYIRTGIERARSHRSGYMVGGLSFLVVFREGVEAAVFILAVPRSTAGWSGEAMLGIVLGLALLAGIFVLVGFVARQLALRWSLLLTSLFLFVLALIYVGEGVELLQHSRLLSETPIAGGGWLEAVGLNPTWQAVGLQLMVLILAAIGAVSLARRPADEAC